ncbi:feruloyl CoA ortho-hydroxylase 1-like [Solanum tuberosum]|uniref:feruloyl CoA ortho-hydroxylase 1-like n=1 Tax=Solanum tuberosum TaxID=4113 RepID=UPI00073A299C|nr:PREDICTED: feruloyl CoA ortho-hydroxylase 1-like [Solanum tuberosum]
MPPRRANTRNANARNANTFPLVPDQVVSNAEFQNTIQPFAQSMNIQNNQQVEGDKLREIAKIMSNDRYKSIEHCVAVDSSRDRISLPLFVNASLDNVIGPFPQMLKDGEKPVYQVVEYQKCAKPLAKKLLEVLLKGLNVNEINESLEPLLMGTMNININYYPPCPNPSITIAARRHCDVSCITLLFQDETGGLYFRGTKGDNWIDTNPIKGGLAVNISNLLQIMINNQYKSIEQCVEVDSSRARIYVPLFVNASLHSVIGPFPEMLKDGEKSVYKNVLHSDYWDYFYCKRPSCITSLDFVKI